MGLGLNNLSLGINRPVVGGGAQYLDSIDGLNVEFEYDFSNTDSYAGSGTAINSLTATPFTGTDTQAENAATITGTAPTLTAATESTPAYLTASASEDEKFTMNNLTDATANSSKSATPFWVAVIYYRNSADDTGNRRFYDTNSGDNSNGIFFQSQTGANDRIFARVEQNGLGTTLTTATNSVPPDNFHFVVYAISSSESKVYIDSSSSPTTAGGIPSGAIAASQAAAFMGDSSNGTQFKNGDGIAWAATGTAYPTDAQVASIIENLKTRTAGNWITF